MNTEQEVEEKSKDIPNGEYTDRDLQNSKYGPGQSSNTSKKVAMKHESKDKVKGQYVGYRKSVRKKLEKKDQEIKIYKGIIGDESSSLTQFKIDDLRRRIAKVENDKEIIIKNEERYFHGRFYRYGTTPLKLVKKFFSTIVSKLRDYFSVIDVDMDFDQESAENMLNVGFNNSNVAAQAQGQSTQPILQKNPVQSEPIIQSTVGNGANSTATPQMMPTTQQELPTSTMIPENSKLPILSNESGYSVFDSGGDELATQEDINRLNQNAKEFSSQFDSRSSYNAPDNSGDELIAQEDFDQFNQNAEEFLSQFNSDADSGLVEDDISTAYETDGDLDKVLKEIAKVYQEEIERQNQLKVKADERQKQAVEAKKQAEAAAEKERKAKEEEAQSNKLVQVATKKEEMAKKELRLKLDEIRKQVTKMKEQNKALESTIEESASKIDHYEENRKTSEASTSVILTAVEENYTAVKEKNKVADLTNRKVNELNQMLGDVPLHSKVPADQFEGNNSNLSNSEMEAMMARFNRDTDNLSNLNLDSMLGKNLGTQSSDGFTTGRSSKR